METYKVLSDAAVLRSGLVENDIACTFLPHLVYLFDQKNYHTEEIDFLKIQADFFEMFGINVPPLVLENLFEECLDRQYFTSVNHRYASNHMQIRTNVFERDYQKTLKNYKDLTENYKSFVLKQEGIFDVSDDQLRKAVDKIIQKNSDTKNGEKDTDPSNVHDILVNEFMLYAEKNYTEVVDIVNNLSVGNILWDFVAEEKEGIDYFKHSPRIYLDTRCVFKLIGLEGEYWRKVYESFSKSIHDGGGKLFVFSHVLDEINHLIKNAKVNYKSPNFDLEHANQITQLFKFEGYNDAMIDSIIFALNNKPYTEYGFEIDDDPLPENTEEYLAEFDSLRSALIETYKYKDSSFNIHEKDISIDTDIKSLIQVLRQRGNNKPFQMSDIRELFVTTNGALMAVARKKDKDKGAGQIPVCITANYLSTLMWIQSPKIFIESSKEKLLAGCLAAIQPTGKQIKDYLEQVAVLEKGKRCSKEECNYLKQSSTLVRFYTISTFTHTDEKKPSFLEAVEKYKKNMRESIERYEKEMEEKELEKQEEYKRLTKQITILDSVVNEAEIFEHELNLKAVEYAKRKLRILEDIKLPIAMVVIALLTDVLVLLLTSQFVISLIIIIASALIVIASILLGVCIKSKNCKLKAKWTKDLEDKYKLRDYKKRLKSLPPTPRTVDPNPTSADV